MTETTRTIVTRIQNKYDLAVEWTANNPILLVGEIGFESDTGKFKIGDGKKNWNDLPYAAAQSTSGESLDVTNDNLSNLQTKIEEVRLDLENIELLDTKIKLEKDLYAYTSIGKITGASNTNPIQVASAGSSLKDVFDKVFGTQQDTQPTISTNDTKLSVYAGTTSYGGGEYGTVVPSTDVTITFTISNSGTTNYGYRCGDIKATGNQTFYYPITKQNNADIKITLPSSQIASADMVTAGTFVSAVNNILYCNFNSSKQVSIKINLPAGSVTTSQQTRYGQISASVNLGAAQKENQLTVGTEITKFLTYLGNDAITTSYYSGGTKSNNAGSYIISAGYYYPYYLTSSNNDLSTVTSGATKFSSTSTNDAVSITLNTEGYIWFLLPPETSGSKIIQYEALGQWYGFDGGTAGPTDISLKLNSGATAIYKGYCTNKKAAAGTTKFKIV